MRIAPVLLWVALVVAPACRGSGDASSGTDVAAAKAQQDLLRRRDALLANRERLEGERSKVVEQIKQAEASGSDTQALAKQRDDLTAQIESQSSELGQMSDKLTTLSTKLDSASTKLDTAAAMTLREDRMAQRETRVAQREAQLGDRERALASREAQLAQREKETCSAAPPMIIQQAAPRADGKYTKTDVQPLLARARATMQKKGVLAADLPGPAQSLESESTKAMADGDWGKAYFAASQLVATVDAVKLDRAFIQAKTARLSSQVKSSKVDDATTQQLAGVLADVMQKYNDGNFAAANARLNQLAALLK